MSRPIYQTSTLALDHLLHMRRAKGRILVSMSAGKEQTADFVIVGSGIAALRAAVDLAARGRVLILNKGELFKPAANYQLGGVAVALAEDDEVHLHFHDTLLAGDGLCREDAVRALVEEGPRLIHQLIDWGAKFDRNGTRLTFAKAGEHSRSRILHAHGDSTGGEMRRVLMARAKSLPAIHVQSHAFVVDLTVENGRVTGVQYLDEKTGAFKNVRSNAVLLATGGLGQVYKETTNPPGACGDGVAMAYRAGALLSDLEFIQFHPLVLYAKSAPRFVLTEALCAEGAHLRNIDLERFMQRYHEAGELAPRDVKSRALMMEMQKCGSEFNYLDLTGIDAERIKKRYSNVYERCLERNLDITSDLIPIRPAVHYAMGGIATDLHGATSLAGLYAAGEVASTGVHGANRLASNSLLEDLVYGARVAAAMAAQRPPMPAPPRAPKSAQAALDKHEPDSVHAAEEPLGEPEIEKLIQEVRATLWSNVGIIRQGKSLRQAVERLTELPVPHASSACRRHLEARNILETARLIAGCALVREESRGAHYRSDFPLKNESNPPRHSFVSAKLPVYFA